MMNDRTLVKAYALEHGIDFRTVSRARKSPQRFYILHTVLEELPADETVIAADIHSFAALRLCGSDGTLHIDFTWLQGGRHRLTGWEESVTIPYAPLLAFMGESAQDAGPQTWKHLSVCSTSRPRLVFHDKGRLRECAANKTVRKKLARALRDNFRYPGATQINFYHDFAPYSFFFREVCNGRNGICGGLIFHNYHDNLKKANYSVHT